MRKVISLIIVLLMLSTLFATINSTEIESISQNSWNSNWNYYRYLPVNNPINNYQIRIIIGKTTGGDVNCNGHCNNNFSDIRFIDKDNTTELSYWLENYSYGDSAIFWVKLPSDIETDGGILLYYGNSNATTTSNGKNTFERFMDKNDLSDWYGNGYTISEDDDSIYVHGATGSSAAIAYITPYNAPEYKIVIKQRNGYQQATTAFANGLNNAVHLHWHGKRPDTHDYLYREGMTNDYTLYTNFVSDRYYIYEVDVNTSAKTLNHKLHDASWNLLNSALDKDWYNPSSDGTVERITQGDGTSGDAYNIWIWNRYFFIAKWTSGTESSIGSPGTEKDTTISYPSIVYVNKTFNATTPGWQYDHFNIIQDGIDAVLENGIVHVANGTYYENIDINKDGMQLIGEHKNGTIIDGIAGSSNGISIQNQDNISVSNFTIRNVPTSASPGINSNGIHIWTSSATMHANNNCIIDCIIENNAWEGIKIIATGSDQQVNNNEIKRCKIGNNGKSGIYIAAQDPINAHAEFNLVRNCEIHNNNQMGIAIGHDGFTRWNRVENTTIAFNTNEGIRLLTGGVPSTYTTNNVILGCEIANNDYGVKIIDSYQNYIYFNAFLNNNINAYDDYNNTWYNESYKIGNSWSDYNGTDTNGDGIGEIPYDISGGMNQDLYPITDNYHFGPVALWYFDEGSGLIAHDSSGFDHHGIIYGATWNTSFNNSGLSFDGNNDYVKVNDSPPLKFNSNDFTVSAWIKTDCANVDDMQIIEKMNRFGSIIPGFYLRVAINNGSDNYFEAGIRDTGPECIEAFGTTNLSDNSWHHLVAVFDRDNELSIFVDGNKENQVNISSIGDISVTNPLYIGRQDDNDNYFNGCIDEVKIYNRCLHEQEIIDEFNQYQPSTIPLLSWYPNVNIPKSQVLMNVFDGDQSYFIINLSNVPDGFHISNNEYYGWCFEKNVQMTRNMTHKIKMCHSYDPNMPDVFKNVNWSMINYVINAKGNLSKEDIQDAIWSYIEGVDPSTSESMAILNDAESNGYEYIPKIGDKVAVLLYLDPDEDFPPDYPPVQHTFIEVPLNYTSCNVSFWKNHDEEWYEELNPDDLIKEHFNLPFFKDLGNVNLTNILIGDINSSVPAIIKVIYGGLLKEAVVGMLNDNHPCIHYPVTEDQIIVSVHEALTSIEKTILLNMIFEVYNLIGCNTDMYPCCPCD